MVKQWSFRLSLFFYGSAAQAARPLQYVRAQIQALNKIGQHETSSLTRFNYKNSYFLKRAARKATLTIHGGETTIIEKPFRASGFEYQIEEAMRCIRAGKLQSDVITWKDTLGNMRTMDQILTQIGVEYPFCPR